MDMKICEQTVCMHSLRCFSEKPSVTVNCSNLITVHQGDSITCVCRGEGGIPAASVTWYKNQTQVGETGTEQETLVLANLDVSDSGSYKCVAQSDQLRDEKSIEVVVYGEIASVRLKGPLSESGIGRVEILHNGEWGTICDDGWDLNDAKVVCRQLGYLDAVRSLRGYMAPSGDGQIWLDEVGCTGRESSLTNCSYTGWGKSIDCQHSDDAGVECTNEVNTPPVRLKGPLSEDGTGRVEVFFNGEWGTICDDTWNTKNARVVCRQLGYPDAARTLARSQVSPGSGPIWLDNVVCTGREKSLDNCQRGAITVPIRLRGPSSKNGIGRVELLNNGTWGTICDNGWDLRDARVVCRQLGYMDAVRVLPQGEVHFDNRHIWLEDVDCTGIERSLANCSYVGWGNSRCQDYEDAGVECTRRAITASLRLKGPFSENGTGRVEVYYNGTWGTICDDEWDTKDARVVCHQLGYEDAIRALHENQVPSGSGKMWLDEVDCTGKEQNIADCSHIGWGSTDCGSHENAGVECSSTAITVSLRIQGPSSANGTGRIEVLYNGQWGTICDDGWDIKDARVVCRQLGYPDAFKSLQGNEVISGSGPIWLTEVDCTGGEENLTQCSNAGWGNSNCAHSEDAGVQCATTEVKEGFLLPV
ncbi:deleted in malignant brain tumors 1 protein-like [Dendronephthya gigantea]|uniref:deleted in malignant brain tumors 1 protein-like n=1 Tax=Dendronephthya gigantea TaxID=151771 RepID=UPI00106B9F30|nr:deleted in malignant brain tumors 1 protein-like [Dendronephthya gigantea]